MNRLLAIDLGVRTGLALFNSDCKLEWYRSQNYGNKERLSRDVYSILKNIPELRLIIIEGGGPLFKIWKKEAIRLDIELRQVQAHEWRKDMLYKREQRNKKMAKQHAIQYASKVIEKLSATKPVSLTDDVAEAILTGYWVLKKEDWCANEPANLR